MTVSTQYQPFTFKPGAAMTAEAIPWQFLAGEQIVVTHIAAVTAAETVLVLGDDYSISGSGPDGTGSVTALAAWPVNDDFRVERATSLEQEYELPPFEAIRSSALERENDRQLMALQEQVSTLTRAVLAPVGQDAPKLDIAGLIEGDILEYRGGKFRRFLREAFAGKFFAGDASGRPVPASGFGADAALRTDLASSLAGTLLVAFKLSAIGAVVRSLWAKLTDSYISVKDFGAQCNDVANDAAAIQAAIDHAALLGGGIVKLGLGKSFCGTTEIQLKPKVSIWGHGYEASELRWSSAYTGNGIKHAGNRNFNPSLVRAYTELRGFKMNCPNAANVNGAGYLDEAGVFVSMKRCMVNGFGYSVILDQTELADIDQNILQSSNNALIWIVNGPDRVAGTQPFFSNRISVTRNQLDNGLTHNPLIVDDGGYAHSFIDNNYNGGSYHIRAAGVSALKIDGGEFEGNLGQPQVILTNTTRAGNAVGGCVGVRISEGLYFSADNRSCIKIEAGSGINIFANYLSTTGALKIDGAQNAAGLNVVGNHPNGAGKLIGSTQLDHSIVLANGANNNIIIPYYAGAIGSVQFISISGPSGAFNITGFEAGVNGQCILVYNGAAATGTIKVASASSAAANRINTSTGIDYALGSGVSAMFVYRENVGRWIQVLNA
jgi:hypothetical protein